MLSAAKLTESMADWSVATRYTSAKVIVSAPFSDRQQFLAFSSLFHSELLPVYAIAITSNYIAQIIMSLCILDYPALFYQKWEFFYNKNNKSCP